MVELNPKVGGTRTPWRAGHLCLFFVLCAVLTLASGCKSTSYGPPKASVRSSASDNPSVGSSGSLGAAASGKTNRMAARGVTNTVVARPVRADTKGVGAGPSGSNASGGAVTVSSSKVVPTSPGVTGSPAKVVAKSDDEGASRRGTGERAAKTPAPPAALAGSTPGSAPTETNMLATSSADVRLRAGLMLDVTVLVSGKKEIQEHGKRVSDSGTLTLPMVGAVMVKDSTLDALVPQLETLYREYFVNPQVIVDFVRDENPEAVSPWGFATVLGRVKKPGRISLPATRDLTISGAIQQAGGFDTSAKDSAIRVTRRREDTGVIETREVNLRAVGAVGKLEDDIAVQPDDVIFVPELVF